MTVPVYMTQKTSWQIVQTLCQEVFLHFLYVI